MAITPPKSPLARRTTRPGKTNDGHSKPGSRNAAKETSRTRVTSDSGLQDYQLGDCLGKGAFGSVYRALNMATGETVAVKQIKMADLPKSELQVITLEIDLLKNLDHPNIVKYHGFVNSADSLNIILEFCEGGSLHSISKNFGKFPENLIGVYMSQVLQGLLYLHEQGVIHRDIKGANILTTKQGFVKLADFGVATRTSTLHESSVVGTPYWMAPEVIELSGATTASDIWSLGCTVIELLDGKPPYHKLQPMHALFRIVNDDHPPIPEGASAIVRDFLMQCFQKDHNLRVSARKLLKHPWITNARRSEATVSKEEAVKSVQRWNEALKSPTTTYKKPTRIPQAKPQVGVSKIVATQHVAPPIAKVLQPDAEDQKKVTADNTSVEIWDDDFASAISPNALQLPHHQPQDHFRGLLSGEHLRAITGRDYEESAWAQSDTDGTESRTSKYDSDPHKTVRPFATKPKPKPASNKTNGHPVLRKVSNTLPRAAAVARSHSHSASEQVPSIPSLHSGARMSLTPKRSLQNTRTTPSLDTWAEDGDDNNTLLADNTVVGRSGKPKQSHRPSDLFKRSKSAIEMLQYSEMDEIEDYSDLVEQDIMSLPPGETNGNGEPLILNSKLLAQSWLEDGENDDDDPFSQLEEAFDDETDIDANAARDRYARLCTQVEGLVESLKLDQPDDILGDLTEQLLDILHDSPETQSVVISAHGLLPILEVLETSVRRDVVYNLLRIVNVIIENDQEVQENLCFVGGIPIITAFASKRHPSEIRMEAATFVRQICQTSTLTLQMFISAGGLKVLVEFLEEDYEDDKELVLTGVNGVWSVFELQGARPKNDFCRILSRTSILDPLSLVLSRVLGEKGEVAELCEERIANIFLLFSRAENYVKEVIAERTVLHRILKELKRMSPTHQITMLKFIKNLSMLSTTLDALQNSNAIDVLIELLRSSMKEPHFREVCNQVLNTIYNLCRLNKSRQEDAALNEIIPILQRIYKTEMPEKEFALPILCDLAQSGKVGRRELWRNKGLQFYIQLLSDPNWQVTALDSIFIWLQEETARVEQHLLDSDFGDVMTRCLTNANANTFESLLEPLQKMLRLSPSIASRLAQPELFSRVRHKLSSKKAVTRLNLLRIVQSICDASEEQAGLLNKHGLREIVQNLATNDQAILVRDMASKLVTSALDYDSMGRNNGPRRLGLRRTSSSSTSPSHGSGSMPPTPTSSRSVQSSTFYQESRPRVKDFLPGSIPLRHITADEIVRSSTPTLLSPQSSGSMIKTRLPRSSGSRIGRPSIIPGMSYMKGERMDDAAGLMGPPIAAPGSRRRRQTSGGDGR